MADNEAAVQNDDPAFTVLSPLKDVDENTRAQAWEVFHNSEGPDFERKLGALNLPDPAKSLLWEAKNNTQAWQDWKNKNTPKPQGFLKTIGSDIGGAVTGMGTLAKNTAEYLLTSKDPAEEDALVQRREQHKSDMYAQAADNFHRGEYSKAIGNLVDLFDPKYDDPNDPLSQAMEAQWQSSAAAKKKLQQAIESKDYLGVVQHSAGILPVASQVDSAVDNYLQDPTRENLAHVVTSALPAFIPSIFRSKAINVAAKGLGKTVARGASEVADKLESQIPRLKAVRVQETATATPAAAGAQTGGTAVINELGDRPVVPTTAGEAAEAGQTVQQAIKANRSAQGAALGAAEQKIPAGFTMDVGAWHTDFGQTLSNIEEEIGGEAEGLSSLKDTEIDKVKELVQEMGNPRTLDVPEINKVRSQLAAKIDQAKALKNQAAARYYQMIKTGFDDEMYQQMEAAMQNPADAAILRSARKTYAETAERQRTTSKPVVRMKSPEQVIDRFAKGAAEKQTEVESIMTDLGSNAEAKTALRQGVLRRIVDSHTVGNKTNWDSVLGNLEKKGKMAESLWGNDLPQIMRDVKENVELGQFKGAAPEKVILDIAKGGPELQSHVEALMGKLSSTGQEVLRDSVLDEMKNGAMSGKKMDWPKLQQMAIDKGEMLKSLLGNDRYKAVMDELAHNARLQKVKGIVTGVTVGTLGIRFAYRFAREIGAATQ